MIRRKSTRPIPLILIAASLILLHRSSVRAANDTWTGNSSANWSDAGNWTGGNAPPLSGDSLVFNGNNNTSTNNDLPVNLATINGLSFPATAGSFILGGNPIMFGGDINDDSTNSQSIIQDVLLDGATSNVNIATGGSLALNNVIYGKSAASTNISVLNLNQSTSAKSITVRTANANANTLSIANGQTFTVTGGMTVGFDPGNTGQTTRLDVSGQKLNVTGGTILIGVTSGSTAGMTSTLHLSGLTEFDFTGSELNLGGRQANGTGNTSNGNLDLANTTNNITVTTLNVGAGSNVGAGNNNNLNLGAGTNTINANTIFVGTHRSTGHIQFAGSTGSLVIRDSSGTGRANINLGIHSGGAAPSASGTLNFNGHNIDLMLGSLVVGQLINTTSTGTVNDSVSFDTGTLDVTLVKLGQRGSGTLGTVNGTLTLGGGNLIVDSTGNPNGGFSMGSNNATGSGTATGTFVLNGGTATVYTDITKGTATTGALIDLEGGTLDMLGHNIGASGLSIVINPASGTLKNVSSINGAGSLTKNTAGTFTVDGNNAWVSTTVNAGTLSIVGVHGGTITVNTGGTLAGNGNGITTGLMNTINVSGGTIHPGTGAGDVAKITTSALNFHNGSLAIDLGPSHTADFVNDSGALLLGDNASSALSLTLAGSPSIGSYELIDYAGGLTKNADFAISGPSFFQYTLDYNTANKVLLNVSVVRGDLTGNGTIAGDDLTALEQALTNVSGYQSSHGYDDVTLLAVADVNQDGVVNNADTQAEIYLLIHGVLPSPPPSPVSVPEPRSLLLAAIGALLAQPWKILPPRPAK